VEETVGDPVTVRDRVGVCDVEPEADGEGAWLLVGEGLSEGLGVGEAEASASKATSRAKAQSPVTVLTWCTC
jgi:hypothetical protein